MIDARALAVALSASALLGGALLAPGCETIPEGVRRGPVAHEARVHPVNGTTLASRVYGRGERAIVFLQGAQLVQAMWEDQAQAFAGDWKVVTYDVRGFGESGPTGEPFAHENDLRALLDDLGIDRPVLVGLSLGGRIAIEFAVEHPDRVAALVLVGPGLEGFAFDEEEEPWHRQLRAAQEARDAPAMVDAWLASGYMRPAMEDPSVGPRVRELARANVGNWLQPNSEVPLDPPAIGRLDTIRCPTLVVVGSRDVPFILAVADHLEREIPGAHKAVMIGCGHVPNLEQPGEFEGIVRRFLASLR